MEWRQALRSDVWMRKTLVRVGVEAADDAVARELHNNLQGHLGLARRATRGQIVGFRIRGSGLVLRGLSGSVSFELGLSMRQSLQRCRLPATTLDWRAKTGAPPAILAAGSLSCPLIR